jgi:hypothetical protein
MDLQPIVVGDNTVYKFAIYDACGINLIDLRPWVIVFTLKRSRTDPDEAAIFQGTTLSGDITIDDQTDTSHPGQGLGYCEVDVPPSASEQLRAGVRFYWAITLFDGAGNPYTPLLGIVRAVGQTTDSMFIYS